MPAFLHTLFVASQPEACLNECLELGKRKLLFLLILPFFLKLSSANMFKADGLKGKKLAYSQKEFTRSKTPTKQRHLTSWPGKGPFSYFTNTETVPLKTTNPARKKERHHGRAPSRELSPRHPATDAKPVAACLPTSQHNSHPVQIQTCFR